MQVVISTSLIPFEVVVSCPVPDGVTVVGSLPASVTVTTIFDGINGLSAYQIALNNGFIGTEIEWLASLKGDQGEVGLISYAAYLTYDPSEPTVPSTSIKKNAFGVSIWSYDEGAAYLYTTGDFTDCFFNIPAVVEGDAAQPITIQVNLYPTEIYIFFIDQFVQPDFTGFPYKPLKVHIYKL